MGKVISRRENAFTMTELLVVIFAVGMLAFILLPSISRPRESVGRIQCVNNLKNVGLACLMYAAGNSDMFPWELRSEGATRLRITNDVAWYFRTLSNEFSTPKILICTKDKRAEATNWTSLGTINLSYFMALNGSEAFPNSLLGGDRNGATNGVRIGPGLVQVSSNSAFGWDETQHKSMGNAVMGDGSVLQLSMARFREVSKTFYYSTNFNKLTLAVP